MANGGEHFALDWIKAELDETLNQVRHALEAYAESGDEDQTRMRACLTGLHQIHGTLVMLELEGVSLLADEMENLAQALLNGSASRPAAAQQALMQSILQLPAYLESIQQGASDSRGTILPLANELREARGEAPLSGGAKVVNLHELPNNNALSRFDEIEGLEKARKIRAAYQQVLLSMLRGQGNASALKNLEKVSIGLTRICEGTPFAALWQALNAFIQSLPSADVDGDAVRLLRRVDAEIRALAQDGAKSLKRPVPLELVRQLIDAATERNYSSDEITEIAKAIDDGPQGADYSISSREAMQTAAAALREQLHEVKDQLDLFVRSDDRRSERLRDFGAPLKQMSSTLSVLGFESSRAMIAEQVEIIDAAMKHANVDDNLLMGVASALIQVDENLAGITAGQTALMGAAAEADAVITEAQRTVVDEARAGLEHIKQGVVDFVTHNWERSQLVEVPDLIVAVKGALQIIPLPRPVNQLNLADRFVRERLLGEAEPDWQELDAFADAISGIDYYLERLSGEPTPQAEEILNVVDLALERLGLGAEPQASAAAEAARLTDAAQKAEADDLADSRSAPPVEQPAEDPAVEPVASAEPAVPAAAAAAEPAAIEAEVAVPESGKGGSRPSTPFQDGPDEEILEIFVEEMVEVLETINEYLPKWAADFADEEALTEVRRAFHTLKGSGRIVGADVVGELAWSVENMLNRVIDETVEPHGQIAELVADVAIALPGLREGFHLGTPVDSDLVAALMERADILASGGFSGDDDTPAEPQPAALVVSDDAEEVLVQRAGDAARDEIFDLFDVEAEEHLSVLEEVIDSPDGADSQIDEVITRAAHTLRGSASIAGFESVISIAAPLHRVLTAAREQNVPLSGDLLEFFSQSVYALRRAVAELRSADASQLPAQDDEMFEEEANRLLLELESEPSAPSLGVVAAEPLFEADGFLAGWRAGALDLTEGQALQEALQQVMDSAAETDFAELAGLADALLAAHQRLTDQPLTELGFQALSDAHERLLELIDAKMADTAVPPIADVVAALSRAMDAAEPGLEIPGAEPSAPVDSDASARAAEVQRSHEGTVIAFPQPDREAPPLDREAEAPQSPRDAEEDFPVAESVDSQQLAKSDDDDGQDGEIVELELAEPPLDDEPTIEALDDDSAVEALDDISLELDPEEITAEPPVPTMLGEDDAVAVFDDPMELADEPALEEAGDDAFALVEELDDEVFVTDEDPPLLELDEIEADAELELEPPEGSKEAVALPPSDEDVARLLDDADADQNVGGPAQTVPLQAPAEVEVEFAAEAVADAAADAALAEPAPMPEIAATAAPAALPDDVDVEIIEIFFEEADEILETLDQNIHQWLGDRGNGVYLENLLRALHTLKGGARLAGLMELGEQTHGFESFLIGVQDSDDLDESTVHAMQTRHDELAAAVNGLKVAAGLAPASAELPAPPAAATPEPPPVEAAPPLPQSEPQPAAADSLASGSDEDDNVVPLVQEPPTRVPQEMVRVSASLLEDLVNLAGESSIVRARIEQGMSDFTGALEEMETTIERLREQLRRLEIETEAQVLFRQERSDGPSYQEFDPLEMDRYSQLQQLSRGLSESASDMLDLKETLTFKARESETLLIQQARLNTELQEGLMRTRMVPFSRLLPRLRRIVRQVARDLDKQVDFHAYNAEGELDRNVLERMVPPLEHMLRNSVDHGIESPEARRSYGKPQNGRIDLRLSREAGDVVIEISDDGSGIEVETVRRKAIERGLMAADGDLSDDEVLAFVLAPGFSTAESVTQISGRGVGMDVVQSEVKQLGGSIEIGSLPGKGTRFTVRLPFTVSVNRALMVSVGDDTYAIPLNTIEGIVLVGEQELRQLYEPDGHVFEYAGMPYRVRYLGAYLGQEFAPRPEQTSVPMVLVRSGDHAVAIHVDGVQGSREIVVKSLGPQFAGVGGISGATILGDGSVVVILDLLALIRAHGLSERDAADGVAAAADRARCVMVVDDSVTVRKVTSRLLERQGMDVIVAKDGVEAVAMLQERRPDIMLLDIEMPRMDGFEVARQVRHDERLASLPIVMVSSRTGQKHKERAADLGVNRFLGKPFQENELLATIDELVELG